jgi:hypothetical protein
MTFTTYIQAHHRTMSLRNRELLLQHLFKLANKRVTRQFVSFGTRLHRHACVFCFFPPSDTWVSTHLLIISGTLVVNRVTYLSTAFYYGAISVPLYYMCILYIFAWTFRTRNELRRGLPHSNVMMMAYKSALQLCNTLVLALKCIFIYTIIYI